MIIASTKTVSEYNLFEVLKGVRQACSWVRDAICNLNLPLIIYDHCMYVDCHCQTFWITQLLTHLVAIELKLSTRMRSSSSLLEIVFVTDTVQLYMIGSAWDYISIFMMKVIKMGIIMMIRRVVKKRYLMVRLIVRGRGSDPSVLTVNKWENFDPFFPLKFDSLIFKTHFISFWRGSKMHFHVVHTFTIPLSNHGILYSNTLHLHFHSLQTS